MAATCIELLDQVPNGVSAPLFFDGQVIRADDLSLASTSQADEIWRMRRLLHGWGVVAGLVVMNVHGPLVVSHGDSGADVYIVITPGYGICPSGAEVYMPGQVKIDGIVNRLLKLCGPRAPGCELNPVGIRPSPSEETPVTGWLIARPVSTEADPRAGLPQGCAHPGNLLQHARLCGGVALELRCDPPDGHVLTAPACADISSHICAGKPIFMPPENPSPDLLILAVLSWDGKELSVGTTGRRHLYPVSLLQDFLTACLCAGAVDSKPEAPNDVVVSEPAEPAQPGGSRPAGSGKLSWDGLTKIADKLVLARDPVPFDPGIVEKLKAAGVEPDQIVTLPAADVVKAAGTMVSLAEVHQVQAAMVPFAKLATSPIF